MPRKWMFGMIITMSEGIIERN